MLVLDDLHWATKPTLLLVLHLLRAATEQNARLLVAITYRDTDSITIGEVAAADVKEAGFAVQEERVEKS